MKLVTHEAVEEREVGEDANRPRILEIFDSSNFRDIWVMGIEKLKK